jgi:HEPN domain-containing protein
MAHMVAEYSLKAYLMLNKQKIEKSHDLIEILNRCISIDGDNDFETIRTGCQMLTQYRIDAVYPGIAPEIISVEEAQAAIQASIRIQVFVYRKAEEFGYSQND